MNDEIYYIFDEKLENRQQKKIKYIIKNNCWVCVSHGNGKDYTTVGRNGKRQYTHRYVYELKYGIIPLDMVVMHKCDNPACINPEHLNIGTQQENINDCINKGRYNKSKGANRPLAKLTDDDVRAILKNNSSYRKIAIDYNVSYSVIQAIKSGRTWKHINRSDL